MAEIFTRPRNRSPRRANRLLDVTVRDFSGGWNVVDNDLNMATKFSKNLKNMRLGEDGSIEVRPGTKLFSDLDGLLDSIINIKYYNGHVIAVGKNGNIVKIDSEGTAHTLFNEEYANALSGSPSKWDTTDFCSFAEFNGDLIICNGVNKPLKVNNSMQCTYLNDPATGSNANTPIGKYVVAHDRYLIIAGNPDSPDTIYISSTDTNGVFVNDPTPNDSVNINLGSRVPQGSQTITGLGRFRDRLLIAFENVTLVGTLGSFKEDVHVPTFDDAIEEQGTISHRALSTVGEDMLFCDNVGVASVSKALYTGAVKSDRISALVDPEIQKTLGKFTDSTGLRNRTFSVFDSLEQSYMLFIPNADGLTETTETRGFAYRRIKSLRVKSWYEVTNMEWSCATISALKRVFFAKGTEVFIYGNDADPVHKDREGSEEMFDDDFTFTDYTGFSPVADSKDSGIYIPFEWELPWSDNQARFNVKVSRYINFDTEGDQRFSAQMFVDNIYEKTDDFGETWLDDFTFDDSLGWDVEVLDPALEMEFLGGTAPGFGTDEYGQLYGGGRPTRIENLYAWTSKYKLFKLRVIGDAAGPLKFVSLTLAYNTGSIRR
tara:strand:- start:2321 stop:4123 length:1803 start_codon:yes stop_codon:yes gene_type:complete